MQINLEINDNKAEFFLEYLNSLKDGIVKNIQIIDNKSSFEVSSIDEVKKRVLKAEKNANFQEHNEFWQEFGV